MPFNIMSEQKTRGNTFSRCVCKKDSRSRTRPDIPISTYLENKTYPEKGAIGIVSVFKIQPDTYSWQISDFTPPAVDNLVIYEMLLRDFTSSSDINGAFAKLDYLQSLA